MFVSSSRRSTFKNLHVEVERLLFLETSPRGDGEDVKLLLSSEKSIEHEREIEYSKPSGHSDELEKCLSRAKVQHPRPRALIARTSGEVIDEAA